MRVHSASEGEEVKLVRLDAGTDEEGYANCGLETYTSHLSTATVADSSLGINHNEFAQPQRLHRTNSAFYMSLQSLASDRTIFVWEIYDWTEVPGRLQ
jgi:hypothetical protein